MNKIENDFDKICSSNLKFLHKNHFQEDYVIFGLKNVFNPIHHEQVDHQLKISYCWTQAL